MVKMRKLKVWANTTDSTPPRFIKVPLPSQESDRSCICVLDWLFLRFSYWIIELF
jgi:hypothetical protein